MFKNLQPALKWVLSLIAFPLFSTDPTPPPNVLIIFPDQMRSDVMGCMGNQEIKTPHIDQLAKEGVLLLKTYANNPVCCPARAILLTGTYNHINGMTANDLRLREDHITIAELMQQKGYRTGFIGKWHLDGALREPGFVPPGPRRQGFEYWAAYECHHKHFEPYYFRDTPEKLVFNEFEPKVSCDFALEFLNTQPKDKPFFMILQMGPPHDPYGAPKAYMDQYNPEHITPRPNWQPRTEPLPKTKPSLQSIVNGNYNPPIPSGTKNQIAAYYAAVTAIDDQVGRIMAELKRLGLDDNTLILFTSDHGDMLSSHGMHRKRKPH
jgi:arylsulfatase A-like enzyme